MKTLSLVVNAAVASALAAVLVFAAAAQPHVNLAINFTNTGKGSAYIHWSLPPGLTNTPSSLNFGTVKVGASATLNLMLLNDGAIQIQLQPLSITGTDAQDFSFLSQCPEYLNVSEQCQVDVTFKPHDIGAHNAALNIPFAGMGINAPASMQITITKLQPPSDMKGHVI